VLLTNFVPELFVRRRQEPELPNAMLLTKVAPLDPSLSEIVEFVVAHAK